MKKTLLIAAALFVATFTSSAQISLVDPTEIAPRVRIADTDYTHNFTSGVVQNAGSGANVAISDASIVNGTISFDVASQSTDFLASIKFQVRKLYGNSGSIDFTVDGTTDSFVLPSDAAASNLDAFETFNFTFSENVTITSVPKTITLNINNVIQDAASKATFRYYNVTFTNLTLGVDDFETQETSVKVYPNPVTNSFQLSSTEDVQNVQIYSITGSLLKTFNKTANYDISDLATGIYIANVKTALGSKTVKIVKQ